MKRKVCASVLLLIVCTPLAVATPCEPSALQGKILFTPMESTKTYLVDESGSVVHVWDSAYRPDYSVYWLPGGSILRTMEGVAGVEGVQKLSWDGDVLWQYQCTGQTHDVCAMPNGNVLILAFDPKTRADAIAAGRNPSNLAETLNSYDIIEVKPTGPTTGTVVWRWRAWDHLIQDYDSGKQNYGVVADHPELININFGTGWFWDLLHLNSLAYHPERDQIMVCSRLFSEVWIIDHSTTTAQAAGHEGGESGKGGDLLYRWGNPAAYGRGTSANQRLYFPHDASWIPQGCPGAGNVLVFNNCHPARYSTVDEFVPSTDHNGSYALVNGTFGPESCSWSYIGTPPDSFYAWHLSGAVRLPNGNTLICNGERGESFVVSPAGAKLWSYRYPGFVFKVCYVPAQAPVDPDLDTDGVLSWTNVLPGATRTGTFQVRNLGSGSVNWTVDASLMEWGTWSFQPQNGTTGSQPSTVSVSVTVPDSGDASFEGYITVRNTDDPDDVSYVPVSLSTALSVQPTGDLVGRTFLRTVFALLCEVL